MNIYAEFHDRIAAILQRFGKEGRLPADLDPARFVVEPPRDASLGDLACNAAMVFAKEAKAFYPNPRQLATELAFELTQEPEVDQAEVAGPGFLNIRLKKRVFVDLLRVILVEGGDFGRGAGGPGRGEEGQCRICLGQSDRADACRPRPRRRVRRCAGQPDGIRRLAGHARILHQRRRRPGRRARALGLPALSRGARRER